MGGPRTKKTSTTGTSNTARFDAEGLCSIIEVAAKSKVKELKLGDLCVRFQEEPRFLNASAGQIAEGEHLTLDQEPLSEPVPQTIMTADQKQVLRQLQENQMMIEDPIAFEQSVIDDYGNASHGDTHA
jgi:hypothetical protein